MTLAYAPNNGNVIDIYSAWAVFGKNPGETAAAIARDARLVCAQWNSSFSAAEVSAFACML